MTTTTMPPRTAGDAAAPQRTRAVRALPTLVVRRMALSVRTPRSVLVPLVAPSLFALVIAPALATTLVRGPGRNAYMTFVALSTAGLLIPLNCLFAGLGVIIDRQEGAMRELLVAPIRRSTIVFGNLVTALVLTAFQVAVLIGLAAARGASFTVGVRTLWFVVAAVLFAMLIYGLAEILTVRLPAPVDYIGAVPALAIVPYFFAGSLFPITALPHWLGAVAKVIPLTHALALFRYGLTGAAGVTALHNIWGLHSAAGMAALSLAVLVLYTVVFLSAAIRLFTKAGTS
ncbi:MAG TPA: ABC transporter permease [Acidimicrobiales bacterium]|nr:ABC transporter permease [Acidimicrobiales bacterium]